MPEYKWKKGARLKGNAQACGERLSLIASQHSEKISPELVVEDASNEDSPLHGCFEWNNKKALKQYRLHQARRVLNCITMVLPVESDDDLEPVRAFINVEYDDETTYMGTMVVMSDAELRKQTLNKIAKELNTLRQKYVQFKELAELCKSMDSIIAQYGKPS